MLQRPVTTVYRLDLLAAFALLTVALTFSACGPSKTYLSANTVTVDEICPPDQQDFSGSLTRGDCSHRLRTYAAEAACHAGNNIGCAYAAYYYRDEDSPLYDLDKGVELATIGCERGEPVSCLAQASTLYKYEDVYKYGTANNLLRKTCLAGMGLSCRRLGDWYRNDWKGAQKRRFAVGLYKKSCDYGYAPGCRKFADVYAEGFGVPRNKERAEQLYVKACRMNDDKACRKAGIDGSNESKEIYNEYLGVSTEDMVEMYWSACKNDFRHGCTYLGRLIKDGYLTGRYVFGSDRITRTLKTGCDLGAAESCYHLARRHLKGYGSVEANTLEAAKYAKKACDDGYEKGCERYRNYYYRVFNRKKAQTYAKKCTGGDAQACFLSGMAFDYGANFDREMDRAVELLDRGCELDYADACEQVGLLFDQGEKVEQDYERANRYFEKACELGADYGCYGLSFNYGLGRGVAQDPARKLELALVACERGWARGCGSAGYHYFSGNGTDTDDELGRKYSLEGCRNDYLWACNNFARALRDGRGGEEDDAWARKLLKRSCKRGNGQGCSLYAHMLATHQGPDDEERDMLEVAKYYEMGCLGENAWGCRKLAELYTKGEHFPRDEAKAALLLEKGCQLGGTASCIAALRLINSKDHMSDVTASSVTLATTACEAGVIGLCELAAKGFRFGRNGIARDLDRANEFIDKAIERYDERCAGGNQGACYMLVHLIAHGRGTDTNFAAARKYLEDACKDGRDEACSVMAEERLSGELFERDPARGMAGLQEACDQGSDDACYDLAFFLDFGDVGTDPKRAAQLYAPICEKGEKRLACANLGAAYVAGRGVERDVERGLGLLSRACDDKFRYSCSRYLQAMLRLPPSKLGERNVYDIAQTACENGVEAACLLQGEALQAGFQVERDVSHARRLYKKACEEDSVQACSRKNALTKLGLLEARSTEDSLESLCKAGGASACLAAGVKLEFSSHDPGRYVGAADFYRSACELGDADGCELLAHIGVDADGRLVGRRLWDVLVRACELGSAKQCVSAGSYIDNFDWHLGLAQYHEACKKGDEDACEHLENNGYVRPAIPDTGKPDETKIEHPGPNSESQPEDESLR
jgi:TPR repeat protein